MLHSLQGCRAAACLLVVVFHTHTIFALPKYFGTHPFGSLFAGGPIALDILFVLSGFVILHAHRDDLGKPRRLGDYLYRRLHRAYPTYWVVLACILPIYFLIPSFGDGSQRDPAVILRSIFLIPQPVGEAVLGVSWTMSLEVFFYIVFGSLILNRSLGLSIFAAWVCVLWAKPWTNYPLSFVQHPYFVPILGGMVACEVAHRFTLPKPSWWAWAGGLALLGVAVADSFGRSIEFGNRQVVLSLGSMTLMMGLATVERRRGLKVPPFVLLLGDASYSIYLVHFPVLSVLCKVGTSLRFDAVVPPPFLFLLFFAIAVGVGVVFARYVELPLRQWKKRRRKPEPATALAKPQELQRAA
jgi:exopolysaccharide production protein ExoZ